MRSKNLHNLHRAVKTDNKMQKSPWARLESCAKNSNFAKFLEKNKNICRYYLIMIK
jgi:hypothetical protein